MIINVNKYLYTFLLTTVLLHAQYGDVSTYQIKKMNSSIAAMKHRIAQQEERIDGLITIIEGLSVSLNELQYPQQRKTLSNNNKNNNDVLLQKLAAMIDDINENYVSKKELKSVLEEYRIT